MFKVSPVFQRNYASTKPAVVNQGGTSSGKTISILQVLFVLLAGSPNLVCTVVGQDIPNLKKGAIRDAQNIVRASEPLQPLLKGYNKSDRIYEYHNGSIMEFTSYDDFQDAKSGKRDYLFINEANGIDKPIIDELMLRTRIRTFIDYNPNSEFWAHDLHGQPDVEVIISDHRHNPFLSPAEHTKIEALKEKDLELWRVYARGMTGRIEGLVLTKWSVCEEIPAGAKFLGRGIDFGFTNDPTTAIDVYMQDGQLWLDEVLYQTGLTNSDIDLHLLTDDLGARKLRLIADSAEPKSIEELRRLGYTKIEGAQKGPDSVRNGIDILKRYHLNVTRRSTNLRKELANYKWRVDRKTGKTTNEPVDAFNHCIDPVRYVALNCIGKPATAPITTYQTFQAQ
ncbi:MAG: PBSX family phage terminase large subunit [Janthinobacterium lividum]